MFFQEPRQRVGNSKRRLMIWFIASLVHAIVISAGYLVFLATNSNNGQPGQIEEFGKFRQFLIIAVVLTACCKIVSVGNFAK